LYCEAIPIRSISQGDFLMKEHTLRLGTLFLLLAVLFPFSEAQASTEFTALYRYEVDPAVGTNYHDFAIAMSPSGGEAYTGDVGSAYWSG
jgi:hypothetical protein